MNKGFEITNCVFLENKRVNCEKKNSIFEEDHLELTVIFGLLSSIISLEEGSSLW